MAASTPARWARTRRATTVNGTATSRRVASTAYQGVAVNVAEYYDIARLRCGPSWSGSNSCPSVIRAPNLIRGSA